LGGEAQEVGSATGSGAAAGRSAWLALVPFARLFFPFELGRSRQHILRGLRQRVCSSGFSGGVFCKQMI
jgi:hypothetical protein